MRVPCGAAGRHACIAALLIAGAACKPPTLAAAESATVSESAHDRRSGPLEEVVVTAQRREENLLDVPLSVTALSGETLEKIGALDLRYLSQFTPNATVEVARGTNNAIAAYIRGVGQQDHIAGFESGVGLYVDDVYYNRPQQGLLDVYDVERIEVLRGPQGTLYGRNTVGGAIKYVTRRLGPEPSLTLRSRIGSHGMHDAIIGVSAPLGDSLRAGASFASLNLDGFGENLYTEGEQNYNKAVRTVRSSVEWSPTNAWLIRLAGDWLRDDSDLRRGHRTRVGRLSGAPVLDNVYDTRAGNAVPAADAEARGYSLTAEWQARDKLLLRGILALRRDDNWKPVDLDGLPTIDADVSLWDGNHQKTAEAQALFSGDRVEVVGGLFTLHASAGTVQGVVLGTTGELIGRPGLGNELSSDIETRNWAAYADATMRFGEQWSGSVGARYTRDERSVIIKRRVMAGGVSPFFGGPAVTVATTSDFRGSEVFEKFTPRAILQWRWRDEHHFYLGYSEGFKGGGFDPRGLTTLAPDFDGDGAVSEAEVHQFMKFEPEEIVSMEIGWKSVLFDGRMSSRLALFVADYTDIQIPGSKTVDETGDGVPDTWVGITSNAGKARIGGLEWEGDAIAAEDLAVPDGRLVLSWSVGHTDARFVEFIDENGIDVANERVFENTPEWTASASAALEVPVAWFSLDGRFGITTTLAYRDDHFQFTRPIPEFDQPRYTLWDLSLVWTRNDNRWQVGLYGKNLTDVRYKVAGLDITLGLEDNYTVYYGNPRQYWLDLQYRFN